MEEPQGRLFNKFSCFVLYDYPLRLLHCVPTLLTQLSLRPSCSPSSAHTWIHVFFGRKLRQLLASLDEDWKIRGNDGRTTLTNGGFRIDLQPRTLRLLDAIHLYSDGAEVWLPLLTRLRLRAAARWRLIHEASKRLQEMNYKKTQDSRAHRRNNDNLLA